MQVSGNGSGLGAKDTETPYWYDLLDPIFTESVDSFTEISSKAEVRPRKNQLGNAVFRSSERLKTFATNTSGLASVEFAATSATNSP